MNISIHALLTESDVLREPTAARSNKFLSTLSLRRATIKPILCKINARNFYPRSPYGERQTTSIKPILCKIFLSTLSLRRATRKPSIQVQHLPNFYPRSPYGERRGTLRTVSVKKTFLSTLSLRRATAKVHKTVEHFCAYETNFMEIASSC